MLTFTYMEILKNITESMMDSPNGPLGHFAGLFGTGFLGAVHSLMTSYYETVTGGASASSGASSSGSGSSSYHSSSGATHAPNLSDVIGNEFDLTPSETTTLADVVGNQNLTLADVVGN